jgi:diguanylate cyclase (GGDEF)-like protein/PAS domain S-box-containing protein
VTHSFYALPTLFTAAAILVLGAVVMVTNHRSRTAWRFLVLTLACGIWLGCFSAMYLSADPGAAERWARAAYLGIPAIPAAIYHFAVAETRAERQRRAALIASWGLAAAFSVAALFSGYWITGVHRYAWGFYPSFGVLGLPFLLYFFVLFGAGLLELRRDQVRAVAQVDRDRSRALLVAFVVASPASVDYVAAYGVSVYPFGYVFVLGFIGVVAHTIGRYRLADQSHLESESRFRALAESATDAIVSADASGLITYFNPRAEMMFGHTAGDVIGQPLELLFSSRGADLLHRHLRVLLAAVDTKAVARPMELAGRRRDGSEFALELSLASWKTSEGRAVSAILRDATERQRAQHTLQASERRFRVLTESSTAAVLIFQDGLVRYANPAAGGVLGRSPQDLAGRAVHELASPSFRETFERNLARLADTPVPLRQEMLLLHADGQERWADVSLTALEVDGRPAGLLTGWDVTEHKLAESALRESERRVREILENIQLVAVVLDTTGEVTYANPFLLELLGSTEEEVVGQDWFERFVPLDRRAADRRSWQDKIAAGMVAPHQEGEIVTATGERRLVSWNNTLRRGTDGSITGSASIGSDVTERRRMEARLAHDAFHDALTGLSNRALFMDRLAGALARHARRKTLKVAVLFLDLDRFKLVNDSLGHGLGDELLVAFSKVLQTVVRPGDTVARLGGDEFTILLEDVEDEAAAVSVADRIQATLRAPFALRGHEVFVTSSIGIALGSGPERAEELVRDADIAMYRAKADGKAHHQLFDATMHTRARQLLELETDLRRAVEREAFVVHYQPVVELASGLVVGFEALVRWDDTARGLIGSGEFIHLAEETGLITRIGRQVLKSACRQMRDWEARATPGLTVSVNLSSRQFLQPDLVEQVDTLLRESGLPPHRLKLEITESVIMSSADSSILMLARLRELGIKVCIDDFGTGYSSLSYLLRFPSDELKIDRSFVMALTPGGRNVRIVETIISLGHGLGMEVVAEGVETEAQRRQLVALGCRHGQGFLFSRAVEPVAAGELIDRGRIGEPLPPVEGVGGRLSP